MAVFLLLLYLLDASVGVFYEDLTSEYGRKNLSLALAENDGNETVFRSRPHPYLTFENTPDYVHKKIKQTNGMGYRSQKETRIEKGDLKIRILALGGSTTYGQGVDHPDEAWPAQLEVLLNNALGLESKYTVEVINGGLSWATSAELLNHYLYRDRYLSPDMVIVHSGGNDGGPLKHDGYTPEYTHWRTVRAGCGPSANHAHQSWKHPLPTRSPRSIRRLPQQSRFRELTG